MRNSCHAPALAWRSAALLVLLLTAPLPARSERRYAGTLPFAQAQKLVDALREAEGIKERFVQHQTLSILPPAKPSSTAATTPTAPRDRPAPRPPHPPGTIYLYWEGGSLEVSALIWRGRNPRRLVTLCNGFELADALPLDRKTWRLGIAPKATRPALQLVARFTKPIDQEAFLSRFRTFRRSALYLANHVLPTLARKDPARTCPKPRAWALPVETLTD